VEASHFFDARELSWKWPNLTWLALNSRLLVPQERPTELDDMLRAAAAAAAMKMPNFEAMEIWNGEKGLAMLFRYQRVERVQPAVITWRGTWELTLRPLVIQAWDSVARGIAAKDMLLSRSCWMLVLVSSLMVMPYAI
jgi:hypothetical protein